MLTIHSASCTWVCLFAGVFINSLPSLYYLSLSRLLRTVHPISDLYSSLSYVSYIVLRNLNFSSALLCAADSGECFCPRCGRKYLEATFAEHYMDCYKKLKKFSEKQLLFRKRKCNILPLQAMSLFCHSCRPSRFFFFQV